jgi:hypothetical protein
MDDDDKDILNDQGLLENRVHSLFKQFHGEAYEYTALRKLDPLKEKDINTYKHSLRVSLLAYACAKALRPDLDFSDLRPAAQFGLIHDAGKGDERIPGWLLLKRTIYTRRDMDIMRNHSRYGFEMLNGDLKVSAFSAYASHSDYSLSREINNELKKEPSERRQVILALLRQFNPLVEIADNYDAMVTRDNMSKYNKKFGGRIPPGQTKEIMLKIKKLKKYKPLMEKLYDADVLGTDYARVLGLKA